MTGTQRNLITFLLDEEGYITAAPEWNEVQAEIADLGKPGDWRLGELTVKSQAYIKALAAKYQGELAKIARSK